MKNYIFYYKTLPWFSSRPSKHKIYFEHHTFGLRQALRSIEHEAPKREYSFVHSFSQVRFYVLPLVHFAHIITLKLLFNLLLITIINWCISQVGVALCSPQTRITSCQQRRDYITVIFFVNFCYLSTNKKIWRQNIISEHAQYSSMPFISIPPP